MFNLSSYLEKFKNLKDQDSDKILIKEILLKEAGINISERNIIISKEKISIKGSSIQKNIIFLKKETILEKIKESLPNSSFKDIS